MLRRQVEMKQASLTGLNWEFSWYLVSYLTLRIDGGVKQRQDDGTNISPSSVVFSDNVYTDTRSLT